MNRLEIAKISTKLQLSQELFDSCEEHVPDCGFASFMRSHLAENGEVLDYEKLDLVIDAYSLVALPSYDGTKIHFDSILTRVTKDM